MNTVVTDKATWETKPTKKKMGRPVGSKSKPRVQLSFSVDDTPDTPIKLSRYLAMWSRELPTATTLQLLKLYYGQ